MIGSLLILGVILFMGVVMFGIVIVNNGNKMKFMVVLLGLFFYFGILIYF